MTVFDYRIIAVPVVIAGCVLAACGESSPGGSPTPTASIASTASTASTATSPPTVPPTQSQAPATVDLSGSWTGTYNGPFNGSFTLNWTQSGTLLRGTIMLSSPQGTHDMTGIVSGSSITFGSGGVFVYRGTVSGNSMSGSYFARANGQMGTWSANKS